MRSATVEHTVHARLILSGHSSTGLRARLGYRADDPFALTMAFPAEYSLDEPLAPRPGAEVVWVFARQLLACGLDLPSGLGDVHVRPSRGAYTMVELRAPEGLALLRFDAADLRRFLWASYRCVPEGAEGRHLDADRALAELLR
ncbi:SsgA family sporulation/cell division regulator [Kitasatospora sp. NBC_01287]|uniref:SsgA family sporulation/cell division regulator n=1 Tax=Kitasatospora sp. NBC_01287 TaxID=2903573 RepID=UPI00225262C3|nr:SsgA family sporulation/cell division regulator [Kitasatospora sp. NBC_01287]MCX4748749.1 SsgA family sporulation/cell division regulator [Kitasatospora sp. NBC_01287]